MCTTSHAHALSARTLRNQGVLIQSAPRSVPFSDRLWPAHTPLCTVVDGVSIRTQLMTTGKQLMSGA